MSATEEVSAGVIEDLIRKAHGSRASDIHLEPREEAFHVRLRIDGVLQATPVVPTDLGPDTVRHIKAMADMDTETADKPQDGRILFSIDDRSLDLRVSCIPTIHGERITVRILDTSDVCVRLDDLRINADNLNAIRGLLKQSHGIILSTGPTGSGKTTTMYSMLMDIDREACGVFSIEDPVEYALPGVSQVAVRPARGVTFVTAARAIMRQDPDVIMIGEIRDTETANVAVQMALTGHLVLTQLHAGTAAGALMRLLDMGVEPFLVNQSVLGVISQRLVRILCPACKRPMTLNRESLPPDAIAVVEKMGGTFYEPVGCSACKHLGYRGRRAIQEILIADEGTRQAVATSNLTTIRDAAQQAGMRTLLEDGLALAAQGITSISEVLRVAITGPHE